LSGDPCVHQAIFGGTNPHSRGPALRERADKATWIHWIRTLPGVRGFLRWSSAKSVLAATVAIQIPETPLRSSAQSR
jgi:hypothetical protein